jgi:hypothetical protein
VAALSLAADASAQTRPAQTTPSAQSGLSVRGIADLGVTSFTASDSFEAVVGRSSGPVFGGGIEFVERSYFLVARAARFSSTGERVAEFRGEIFQLGIPAKVTIVPFELSGGYRFQSAGRLVPYAGGGIGWHRYKETSDFASDEDNVSEISPSGPSSSSGDRHDLPCHAVTCKHSPFQSSHDEYCRR